MAASTCRFSSPNVITPSPCRIAIGTIEMTDLMFRHECCRSSHARHQAHRSRFRRPGTPPHRASYVDRAT
jgi:hypothetical protein